MWLLDVSTLQLCEYFGADIPPYAILSHKWGPKEVSFREVQDGFDNHFEKVRNKASFRKIQNAAIKPGGMDTSMHGLIRAA